MSKEDLKMWQKLIIDEVSNEEFNKFIQDRYKYLAGNINKYGFWETIDRINLNDYPDHEFQKLVKYYKEHKELLANYIKKRAGNGK
jgi:hypothetical protein